MCGIVGVLSFADGRFAVTESLITDMRDAMIHRGPDGAGVWISQSAEVGLGHRRLSIIDLSTAASQPMCNEDGSLWVVFNGEIYNHAEIRRELEALGGHTWKTDHSDTEMILHAFEQWGIDAIHRFRGMFAIALWDEEKRELWLVRDRIGIKPLYYSVHHGRISFASEIKALLKDPDQARAVDEEGLFNYLSFLTTPAPQTLFAGIQKLTNGTWMRVDRHGAITSRKYWDVLDHTTPLTGISEDEISRRLMVELRTAVALRKVSDVPVGVFLSGGIDSSTNAALFSEGERRPVQTFSIGYDENYKGCISELPHALAFARKLGAEHHDRVLTQEDFLDFLPRMIQLQDEPIADPVCMPIFYVSKLARDAGVIVCQVGEGSDELFWGYSYWEQMLKLQRWNTLPVPHSMRALGLGLLAASGRKTGRAYEMLRRSTCGQPLFWGGAEALTHELKMQILSPRLRRQFRDYTSWEAIRGIRTRFTAKAWETTPLKWMTYLDLNLRLPELLLMRVDKMSMGVSLEARVPFLDHKFVELAMSIPESLLTKNGERKYVLKRAVAGAIPDEIIQRKKQGFGVPIYEWFFDRLGTYTRRELASFCEATDFFDAEAVMKIAADKNQGWNSWYLLNFALWWREYISGPETRDPSLMTANLSWESRAHA
ncbi:MAG: asparagine synthase (glutamine-hydrolyzing) [Candidatus Korobacteraceae bacterium]